MRVGLLHHVAVGIAHGALESLVGDPSGVATQCYSLATRLGALDGSPALHQQSPNKTEPEETPRNRPMDLRIAGRKAIVCASSRGLGKACALALAQAGCEVVINGRDGKMLEATAAEIAKATGAKVV